MPVAMSLPVAFPAQGTTQVKDDQLFTSFSAHAARARTDVRLAAAKKWGKASFELIFTPSYPIVRLPDMATNTRIDLTRGRCRKARRFKKVIREEAMQHGLRVEFKAKKETVMCDGAQKEVTLLYATFTPAVASAVA